MPVKLHRDAVQQDGVLGQIHRHGAPPPGQGHWRADGGDLSACTRNTPFGT